MTVYAPAVVLVPVGNPFNPAPVTINGVPQPTGTPPERAVDVAPLIRKQIG
jgi:hypothetical protein